MSAVAQAGKINAAKTSGTSDAEPGMRSAYQSVSTLPQKSQMIESQRLELRTAERFVAECVLDFRKDVFRSPVVGS